MIASRLPAILVLAVALAACSGGGDDTATDDAPGNGSSGTHSTSTAATEPVERAPAGLSPLDAPDALTEVQGVGYRLSVPDGFVEEDRTTSTGEPLKVLVPSGLGDDSVSRGNGPLVGVVTEPGATVGALEQSLTLETAKRLVDKATNVRRTVVSWPGASQAVLLDWTVRKPVDASSGATHPVRTVQLLLDVDDAPGLTVVVVAPADSFDDSQVATALRTFRPTPTVSS